LNYNPATVVVDSPVVFDDAQNEFRWKPQNFESDFKGETTVRNAVIHSLNVPAVKTLSAVGVNSAIEYAKKLGIKSTLQPNLSLALGGSCVTLWELTNVYANLARLGTRVKPIFIRKVVDRDGKTLENNSYPSDLILTSGEKAERTAALGNETDTRVLDEKSAFILVKLLREVCTSGTAGAAARLGIPVGGKTGTTNDSFDAWFIGFSKHLVTGVWVGFDTYEKPLGRWETGGKAALPIWMAYTAKALAGMKEPEFEAPPGIVFLRMNPDTGAILPEGATGGISEPFKKDKLPDSVNAASKTTDFMKIDSGQ
ncbi:MAG: penicillin-binding transpeptidase domain-containing protein, partial [Myxococcota bacterium]